MKNCELAFYGRKLLKDKILIIPDSFKGSMSSAEVASIIEDEVKRFPNVDCVSIPIADGGEGSVESILSALGGEKKYVTVKSPENIDISAFFGITNQGVAIIEIAESSGLTKQTSFQVMKATTFGFGQLIKAAMDQGCETIYLCLGGSATTDCGCGMAAALGVRFFDDKKNEFVPVGGSLSKIDDIDFSQIDPRIAKTKFVVMSDVESPLYGEQGAAYVFAPQKGATLDEVKILDDGLRNVCNVITKKTGIDYSNFKGSGAAGGCGCGCVAFLGAKIHSGIETMLQISQFEERIKDCSLIITGEGKIDRQSLMGKVLSGIKLHSGTKPITAFCGICELTEQEKKSFGINIIEIGRDIKFEESMKNGAKYLKEKVQNYLNGNFN